MDKTAGPSTRNTAEPSNIDARIPFSKKARVTTRKTGIVRRKRNLKRLFDMPRDIFSEIVRHLTPPDLLALARSNKFFRNIFMSRASFHFWKAAIDNVPGLPPCPDDLAAPRYVSLIYSKTCSECGARVLRRMDSYLWVKLCNACRKELIGVTDISQDLLVRLIPVSPTKQPGVVYFLRRDFDALGEILKDPQCDDPVWFEGWQRDRQYKMNQRIEYGLLLNGFLGQMEIDHANRLEQAKNQRKAEVERRLIEEGWTRREMNLLYPDRVHWDNLLLQSKPLTDRNWTSLRLELIPLLQKNRERIETDERLERLEERKRKLLEMLSGVRDYWVLADVTVHWDNLYPKVTKTLAPFPNAAEALTWESVKSVIEADTDPEEVSRELTIYEEEIALEIRRWRRTVHQDLINIWSGGQPVSSSLQGPGGSNTESVTSHQSRLPCFTMTVHPWEDNGSSTTGIEALSADERLLLRADTVFKVTSTSFTWSSAHYYPDVIPPLTMCYVEGVEGLCFGDVWDQSKVERDEHLSGIARSLLGRMGRPDATSLELNAMGHAFLCDRCCGSSWFNWEELLNHYSSEISDWETAQSAIQSGALNMVFNNTHDLSNGDLRPVARILHPDETAQLRVSRYQNSENVYEMLCSICESVEIRKYYYHPKNHVEGEAGNRSEIIQHLRAVHDIEAEYMRHCHADLSEGEDGI